MSVSKRTFRMFVEEELGEFPHFIVCAMLEWLLIASLFVDRFLAFLSNKFATLFELDPPCVLCTRIDQSLVGTHPSTFYNNSICESHKKDISSLAFCHVHRKLSDIRNMCEPCLLSFATDKEPDFDEIKKPVEQKDKDAPKDHNKDGDKKTTHNLKPVKTKEANGNGTGTGTGNGNGRDVEMMSKCCCCGDPFTARTPSKAFIRTPAHFHGTSVLTPRVPLTPMGWRNDDAKNMELPHTRYTALNFSADNEPDAANDNHGSITESKGKDEMKSAATTLLPDSEELNDESLKTPKGSKFFGVPLAEVGITPRFANKLPKKLPLEKLDFLSDDEGADEGDSIIHHLKRQIRADRKILTDLYQELNEERSASAVAANNSMAMIARLQTEKASIEMEALQYQRMMEEQAEYDQEAIQILKDMLVQKEKDIKNMKKELEIYKEKYGEIKKEDIDKFVRERDDFESERFQLSGMLNNLENLIQSTSDDAGVHDDKDIGEEKKANLEREMSLIKERMSVMESDSGYLKHTGMALQKGDERADLLTEIAQNLRKLRT